MTRQESLAQAEAIMAANRARTGTPDPPKKKLKLLTREECHEVMTALYTKMEDVEENDRYGGTAEFRKEWADDLECTIIKLGPDGRTLFEALKELK